MDGTAPSQVHYCSEEHPTTVHGYCVGVNTPKHYKQLRVKDLPNVPTWWLEWESNPPDARHRTYHWATTPQKWLVQSTALYIYF